MKGVVTVYCILLSYYNFRKDGTVNAFKVNFFSRHIYSSHKLNKPNDLVRNKHNYLELSSKTKAFSNTATSPSSYSSYISIPIYDKETETEKEILVKRDATEVIKQMKSWQSDQFYSENKVNELFQKGLVIPLMDIELPDVDMTDDEDSFFDIGEDNVGSSITRVNVSPSSSSFNLRLPPKELLKVPTPPPAITRSHVSSYINIGTNAEPVYLKSSKKQQYIEDLKQGKVTVDFLVMNGYAFRNITELQLSERKQNRFDSIASRVHNEHSMSDPVWQKWTDKTRETNRTSLTQVMAEYFQTQSIGDIGGKSSDYIPKRGFSGTLAPGERFKDNDPIDQLSKSILHPWPSLQEIQMHGRMPVTHPMIPPPVLWFGMNDMYTRNFTDWQMSLHKPDDLVVGGIMMTPRDAMIIARNSSFGVSYDHSQQIPHGGSIFYNGHKIPFYNPDHGPTVSAAEAEPPIPKELLPITERWYDPYDNEDILGTNPYENNDTDSNGTITSLSAKSNTHRRSESEIAEENERRAVFEQLYLNTNEDDRSETDDSMNRILLAEEVEKLRTQRTIMERYAAIKDSQLNKIRDLSAQDDEDENELDELVTPSFTSVLGGNPSNNAHYGSTSSSSSSSSSSEKKSSGKKTVVISASSDNEPTSERADASVDDLLNSAVYKDTATGEDRVITTAVEEGDDEWMVQAKGEVEIQMNVDRAGTGYVRSPKQLVKYMVEFVRDLKREMDRGEVQSQLNTGARKRSGKRRKARKSSLDDVADLDSESGAASGGSRSSSSKAVSASLSDSDLDVQALAGLGLGDDIEPDFFSSDGDNNSSSE